MRARILATASAVEITVEAGLAAAARQAAFVMTDVVCAFLDETPAGRPRVFLRSKRRADAPRLRALARMFEEEVHTQRIRLTLSRAARTQRRNFLRKAVSGM